VVCYEQYVSPAAALEPRRRVLHHDTGSAVSVLSHVETCTVRVPLPEALSLSTRHVVAREYALVRVRDEDGVVGIGFDDAAVERYRTTPWR